MRFDQGDCRCVIRDLQCFEYKSTVLGVETLGNAMRDPLTLGIYKQHLELKDGHIPLSEAPGFGIEIDWEFVRRDTVQS
jgi:L-alanine-DL-glutamate epimerase-like enolase superfamily enzyme